MFKSAPIIKPKLSFLACMQYTMYNRKITPLITLNTPPLLLNIEAMVSCCGRAFIQHRLPESTERWMKKKTLVVAKELSLMQRFTIQQ